MKCRCHLEAGDSECPVHRPPPEELAFAASIGAPYRLESAMAKTPSDPEALRTLVLEWFEIHDRPCPPHGLWPHFAEWRALDDKLRAMVGAPRRPRG